MSKWFKSIIWTLVIAFLLYYLYTRPEAAAGFVKGIFGFIDSVGRFFESLIR